jgi:hypothetical protein
MSAAPFVAALWRRRLRASAGLTALGSLRKRALTRLVLHTTGGIP